MLRSAKATRSHGADGHSDAGGFEPKGTPSKSKKCPPASECISLESDVRLTPEWLLERVREMFGGTIVLDPCTEPSNPVGARHFYTVRDNGLRLRWHTLTRSNAFVNCPYSRGQVQEWANKCVDEARHGLEILLLTKDDARTAWNLFLRENADARCRIGRGVGFSKPRPDGTFERMPGPRWAQALHYWGPNRRRFERIFSPLGEVTHLLGPQELGKRSTRAPAVTRGEP